MSQKQVAPPPEGKDPDMWALAQERVAFKKHLMSYLIINGFLWVLWFLTTKNHFYHSSLPWPVWPTLGWGIGLAFNYVKAYRTNTTNSSVNEEYEKIKQSKQ